MSKINYCKVFLCKMMCRWCGPVAYGRYKLVDDIAVDDVDSLHVNKITLIDW
jgi:hypothetical protein